LGTMLNNGNDPAQIQQVKDLNITLMRLTSSGEFEPVNDNSNPDVSDYSNFRREALPTDIIRSINENTNCHKFFYTPWSPANWMKLNKGSNPDPAAMWAGNNKLNPAMYNEFAEYLAAICKTIKEESGVELYAISLQNEPTFNEPYASCQYTGEEFRDMMKIIGPRFEAENINTRIMMPEDIATMLSWVTDKVNPVNADPDARKYLGVMAVHLYDPDGINVGGAGASRWNELLNIKKSTTAEGLWMTETSGFSNVWEGYWGKDYMSGNPQFFPGPLDFAGSMYTAFKAGNISGWTDFEGTVFKTNNDLLGSVFKNYSGYVNPGAVMVDAISGNSNII
jgi:glucuronoarabinoxylan endo-1,4-beta-xylanase